MERGEQDPHIPTYVGQNKSRAVDFRAEGYEGNQQRKTNADKSHANACCEACQERQERQQDRGR